MNTTKVTKAEASARAYADRLQSAGWDVTVTVNHHEPSYYTSFPDEIMCDGFTMVHVNANRRWFDGTINFSFATSDGAQAGRRRTTKFHGGEVHQGGGNQIRLDSTRRLDTWVSTLCI
jgi:hypothetical protein